MKEKLRIGLLIDDYDQPAWVHLMITRLLNSDNAGIVLVVRNRAQRKAYSLPEKIRERWREIPSALIARGLHRFRRRLMENVHCEPDAFATTDVKTLLPGVVEIGVLPRQTRFCDYLSDDDVEQIRDHRLDILVRLGFRILKGDVLEAAKYGVWSYHHGDSLVNRGGPFGFWEVMESWPESGAVLQILGEDLDGGTVLYRSWAHTNDRSMILNNNPRFWTAASFLPRMVDRLGALGEERFFEEVRRKNPFPAFYSHRLYKRPRNRELAALLAKKFLQRVRRRVAGYFRFEQWNLLYAFEPDIATSMHRFTRLVPPRDRFWADPFVVHDGSTHHVFIEELVYAEGTGRIAHIAMDPEGKHERPTTLIEEPHHLSYPFVFSYEGAWYMLAEARQAEVVPIYRCVDFPYKWEFHANLFEGVRAVDPTLLQRAGIWYLFLGMAENPGSSTYDELFLFHTNNPISGPWTPHPLNPVASDVKAARPAGRIVERNGELFRPAQNCSGRYGYGINIMRITALSPTEYAEEPVTSIEPLWDRSVTGVHTLSYSRGLTLADARILRSRFR